MIKNFNERDDEWSEELPWLGQYILDENGDAIPAPGLLRWGQWLEDHPKERQLAEDQIGDARVSTVFLGLDYGSLFLRDAQGCPVNPEIYKPKLWETMVFGGLYDMYQKRYTSKKAALKGHGKIVQMLTS
jgi:hypothetical protein